MIIRYNFPPQKKKKKKKIRAKSSKNKYLGKNSRISANYGSKCELPRRFLLTYFIYLSLNNNIKIPLVDRLGVFEARNIYGKYFVFHMYVAIQEACRILDESILSIEKTSLSNTL